MREVEPIVIPSSITVIHAQCLIVKIGQRDVTIPARFETQFLREDATSQFVLFGKVDEANAGGIELFDKSNNL